MPILRGRAIPRLHRRFVMQKLRRLHISSDGWWTVQLHRSELVHRLRRWSIYRGHRSIELHLVPERADNRKHEQQAGKRLCSTATAAMLQLQLVRHMCRPGRARTGVRRQRVRLLPQRSILRPHFRDFFLLRCRVRAERIMHSVQRGQVLDRQRVLRVRRGSVPAE